MRARWSTTVRSVSIDRERSFTTSSALRHAGIGSPTPAASERSFEIVDRGLPLPGPARCEGRTGTIGANIQHVRILADSCHRIVIREARVGVGVFGSANDVRCIEAAAVQPAWRQSCRSGVAAGPVSSGRLPASRWFAVAIGLGVGASAKPADRVGSRWTPAGRAAATTRPSYLLDFGRCRRV